jgi:conjugative transfer region protein TrbK
MDSKIAARTFAVVLLAAAMAAALMVLRDDGAEEAPSQALRRPGGEPQKSELLRCRDLGIAAADDPACKETWAKSRRRFLEQEDRPIMPKPERFGGAGTSSLLPPPVVPPLSLPVSP